MAPIGVAIVGGGIFVKEQHLPAVLAATNLQLQAIWSRSKSTAEDTAKLIPNGHPPVDLYSTQSGEGKTFEDLLKRSDIGALILALPINDQPDYIKKALTAGKHVLAEKPLAKDIATARELIAFAQKVHAENKATLAIAENFRFTPGWVYGREEVKKIGRVTGFNVRSTWKVELGDKWLNTSWRKKPDYQGGFLLDGGVHFTAALRELLGGGENAVESLIAQGALTLDYLAPIDTIFAIIKLKSGVLGSFHLSAGTAMKSEEFVIAGENGTVSANKSEVTTKYGAEDDTKVEKKVFEKTTGVTNEVKAWADSLEAGKPNPRQSTELALGDLELIEKMLDSAEKDGARQKLEFQ